MAPQHFALFFSLESHIQFMSKSSWAFLYNPESYSSSPSKTKGPFTSHLSIPVQYPLLCLQTLLRIILFTDHFHKPTWNHHSMSKIKSLLLFIGFHLTWPLAVSSQTSFLSLWVKPAPRARICLRAFAPVTHLCLHSSHLWLFLWPTTPSLQRAHFKSCYLKAEPLASLPCFVFLSLHLLTFDVSLCIFAYFLSLNRSQTPSRWGLFSTIWSI